MPIRPPDGSDTGFSVTPERLRDTAPSFHKASKDTFDLEVSLNRDVQQLITDMTNVLSQSPDALQQFFNRWRSAMLSLSDSLQSVGDSLQAAADGYQQTDHTIGNTFYSHGDVRDY